jgi:hypothetical protein
MKWNIYYTLMAPTSKVVELPNTNNPVECDSLAELLRGINLTPLNFGLEYVGLRIERAPDTDGGEIADVAKMSVRGVI